MNGPSGKGGPRQKFLKQAEKRIEAFENYHGRRGIWVSFARLADWGSRNHGPDYQALAAALKRGAFERGGKSTVLFLSAVVLEGFLDEKLFQDRETRKQIAAIEQSLIISTREYRQAERNHRKALEQESGGGATLRRAVVDADLVKTLLSQLWIYVTSLYKAGYGAEVKFKDPTRGIDKVTLLEVRIGGRNVNRRWIGTPDRHPKGTPLSVGFGR